MCGHYIRHQIQNQNNQIRLHTGMHTARADLLLTLPKTKHQIITLIPIISTRKIEASKTALTSYKSHIINPKNNNLLIIRSKIITLVVSSVFVRTRTTSSWWATSFTCFGRLIINQLIAQITFIYINKLIHNEYIVYIHTHI